MTQRMSALVVLEVLRCRKLTSRFHKLCYDSFFFKISYLALCLCDNSVSGRLGRTRAMSPPLSWAVRDGERSGSNPKPTNHVYTPSGLKGMAALLARARDRLYFAVSAIPAVDVCEAEVRFYGQRSLTPALP